MTSSRRLCRDAVLQETTLQKNSKQKRVCEVFKSYCLTYDGNSRPCQASHSILGSTYKPSFWFCSILLLHHHLQYQNVQITKSEKQRMHGAKERSLLSKTACFAFMHLTLINFRDGAKSQSVLAHVHLLGASNNQTRAIVCLKCQIWV